MEKMEIMKLYLIGINSTASFVTQIDTSKEGLKIFLFDFYSSISKSLGYKLFTNMF